MVVIHYLQAYGRAPKRTADLLAPHILGHDVNVLHRDGDLLKRRLFIARERQKLRESAL
jgi:hypothetical protein